VFVDSENDNTEGGRRLREESQARWSARWAMFAPPPGVHREAWFHVDIPPMILAFVVGWPLGAAVTEALTGQQALGGFIGFIVMMLVFGFFRRRLQKRGERGMVAFVRADAPPGSNSEPTTHDRELL